jgi:O-antigen ligase
MRFAAAIFFALALIAAQAAHGGLLVPFLAYPAYALIVAGALFTLPVGLTSRREPWAGVVLLTMGLAGYAFWRANGSPDMVLAWTDLGLILACATMWTGMALGVPRNDARLVFLAICLAAGLAQTAVALVQVARHGEFSMPFWFSEQLKVDYAARFPNRPRGMFMNPNQFAWMMNVSALMALSLGVWGRLRMIPRVVLVYCAAVFAVMTVLSASRGGMISLLVGFCVFLLLSLGAVLFAVRERRVLLLVLGGGMLTLCAGAAYVAFSTSWVAQGRLDGLLMPDVRGRFVEQAFRLFQTEPLFGVGAGMYRYAARFYRTGDVSGDPIYAHDDWLQFLSEYGFVGAAGMLLVLVLAFACGTTGFLRAVRKASEETGNPLSTSGAIVLGAICGLVACAMHSNVDFNMHVPANALLAAALLGLITDSRIAAQPKRVRWGAWLTVAGMLATLMGLSGLLLHRGEVSYRALQADNAMKHGEVDRALAELEAGLKAAPNDPTLLAARGEALFSYESWWDFKNAPAEPETTEEEEDSAEAPQTPNVVLPEADRERLYQQAAASYRRAVELQPLERENSIGLAKALVEEGKVSEADAQFLRAISLDLTHPYAWANYGDFLLSGDDVPRERTLRARRIYEIGANLPSGQYCRDQVSAIDADLETEKEGE